MSRTVVYGCVLVALGLVVGISLGWRGEADRVEPGAAAPGGRRISAFNKKSTGIVEREVRGDRYTALLQRRVDRLASKLAAEADQRRRLEERIDSLATQLAALHGSGRVAAPAAATPQSVAAAPPADTAASGAPGPAASGAAGPGETDESITPMERALVAAGIDVATAAEMKRQEDESALAEIYLRNQAAREGWLNTPRFAEEMAEIQRQRTPIREAIGDDAYDRYLAALDQPNRVAVNEVLLDSPAAAAGLQAGDVVLRYGDTRVFAPNELVAATHDGIAGETVSVEIIRQGQRFEIEVPRGPLGVRVAATKGAPGEG